jgi:poly(A) polymerase
MELKELLNVVHTTAKEIKTSKPYIVGGMVRDIVLKNFDDVTDIDITCGDSTSDNLGQALVKKFPQATYTKFSDGHGCLSFDRFKLDFSNNFQISNILDELKKIGIVRPKQMELELYSRDFTINTLLMPLDLTKIYDMTGLGIKHIMSKTIDTCLEPKITFTADPRRIIRVVYLSAKLGFHPSQRVIDWIRINPNVFESIGKKYVIDRLSKSIEKSPKITADIIKTLNIENIIPKSRVYTDFIINKPELLYKSLNE